MKKRWIGLGIATLGVGACASMADFSSDAPGFSEAPGVFEGRFLALSDASMAGTAYADGKLEPAAGLRDEVTLFEGGKPAATAAASNSVVSWPQVLERSADGRFAYVVESRGNLDPATEQVESAYEAFPKGRVLTILAVGDASLEVVSNAELIGANPQSVQVVPGRPWLAVATETPGKELVFVSLSPDGVAGEQLAFDLAPNYRPDDAEPLMRNLSVSPDASRMAVNSGNERLQFYAITWDADGRPAKLTKAGAPIEAAGRFATSRWTPDGRWLVVTDIGDASGAGMLFLAESELLVIDPLSTDEASRIVSRAKAGIFAEGFEIADDGTRIAVIAMERTYLPELAFLSNWPRRRQYALTLMALEPAKGELEHLDRIRAPGILPEDVIFDASGRNLAVAVFHRRKGPDRQRGFIDFFAITAEGRLEAQGRTQAVMRGPHDLVRLPE